MSLNTSLSSLRVLFLNPPDIDGHVWMKEVGRCGRKSIGGEIWPQTGLAYLAAMAESEGHQARIIDAMAEPISVENLIREVRDWRPDVIVANSATPTVRNDGIVLERLREATGAFCGFVGPHVSALPEETLRETGMDFGMIDEAEATTVEFLRAVAIGRSGSLREALGGVDGIVWRDVRADGEAIVRTNASRGMVPDLDALPFPARHLLPNSAYRLPFFGNHPFATLIPARGCPWPCTFCRAGRVWGRKTRMRSVSSILQEIAVLRKDFGIRHLVFMTDSLTLRREWALKLFAGLSALPEPLEWMCNSRVDAVDVELLTAMKRAGCRMVSYGLESGVQSLLDVSRKGITLEQSARAIRATRKAGIPSMAYFILGLPGETEETVRETIRFAKRIAPDYANFHIATPFPGTELYDQAVANGWLRATDWSEFEEEGSAAMQAGSLTPEQLAAWQSRAMRAFYLRPSRLLREVRTLRSWSDFCAKFKAGVRMLQTVGRTK
jgi:anaerobic magnesium-protoporphyrin IX monomethyl ester cyclase